MLFNSYFFILVFLPLLNCGYFLLLKKERGKAALAFLILMSFWFYAAYAVVYAVFLAVQVLLVYGCSRLYDTSFFAEKKRRRFLQLSADLLLLGSLGVCKYLPEMGEKLAGRQDLFAKILLPAGLSYFTLRQLAFLIDRYQEKENHPPFLPYLAFVIYFPTLIQGPLTLSNEMLPQFGALYRNECGRVKPDIAGGFVLFTFGFAKKMLLADHFAPAVNFGFSSAPYLDLLTTLAVLISYAFQLYFDFSGYTDMALGISMMLGIQIPINFSRPFQAENIRDFWKRWHMTLMRFFTRYVYIPLGGSRRGELRTALNILIVFLVSAVWHGSSLCFLLWGGINGIFVVLSHGMEKRRRNQKKEAAGEAQETVEGVRKRAGIAGMAGRIQTFLLFLLTLIFFRAENLTQVGQLFSSLFRITFPGFFLRMVQTLDFPENYLFKQIAVRLLPQSGQNLVYLATFFLLMIVAFCLILAKKDAYETVSSLPEAKWRSLPFALWVGVLFVYSLCSLTGVSTFLYFKF